VQYGYSPAATIDLLFYARYGNELQQSSHRELSLHHYDMRYEKEIKLTRCIYVDACPVQSFVAL